MTTGRKDDAGKARWDLVPWRAMADVVDVLTYGAVKYGDDNWRHISSPRERYFAAAMRHILAHYTGRAIDEETGRPSLAHAVCCLLFLLALDKDGA
jgi:hypothetical protein